MNKINVVGSMPGFGLTDVEKMIIENADVIFAGTRNIELLNVNKKNVRPTTYNSFIFSPPLI